MKNSLGRHYLYFFEIEGKKIYKKTAPKWEL